MMVLSIVLMIVLVGSGVHSVARSAAEKVYTFEADEENSFPAGFVSGMTGQWKPTEWKVRKVDGNKVPDNYYLLRAVPHEQRVRLYKIENGKRTTFTGKNLAIPVDTWHELKLVVSGNTFTASFNGAEHRAHAKRRPLFWSTMRVSPRRLPSLPEHTPEGLDP